MTSHFFAYLSRMKFIRRWGLMHSTYPENIQEHSLRVAQIAHALAIIKNRLFAGDVSPERAAALALYHDTSEVLTGDLPSPVKEFNPEIHRAYHAIEAASKEKLFGLIPVAIALAPLGSAPARAQSRGKEIVVGLGAEPRTMLAVTIVDWTTNNMLEHMYDRLLDRDAKTFKPKPMLAESWRIVNDTTWEFKLRKGVKFHNGEPFTAQSVKATIDYALDPATKSHFAAAAYWGLVKDVQIVDDFTVRFVTKQLWPNLVDSAASTNSLMMPAKALKELGPQKLAEKPIGTGPFRFVEWKRDERLVLERNPDYWQGPADASRVTFRFIPEFSARMAALLSAEIDIMKDVPPHAVRTLSARQGRLARHRRSAPAARDQGQRRRQRVGHASRQDQEPEHGRHVLPRLGPGALRPVHGAPALPRRPDLLVVRQQQGHRRQDRARPDLARAQGARRRVRRAAAPDPRRGALGLPVAAARPLRRDEPGRVDAARRREGVDVRGEGDTAMSLTVFTNAGLIDCTGADPVPGAAVVVEDDRIKEVAPNGKVGPLPGPVTTLDCRGATLMPGLTDAHVHICAVEGNITDQHRYLPPSLLAAKALRPDQECLLQGFTTVRDAGGADYGFREAIEEGLYPGPRLLVSGRYISQTGGHRGKRRRAQGVQPVDCCIGMGRSIARWRARGGQGGRPPLPRG